MSEYIVDGRNIIIARQGTKTPHLTEIVRCRDCKHYDNDKTEYFNYCCEWCEQVEPDGFCAWGVRRVDGD